MRGRQTWPAPRAPLAAATRYHVTVAGTLNGQGVNLNWSFTTR
ncbi:hypothetical protein [Cupriavidus pauculus]